VPGMRGGGRGSSNSLLRRRRRRSERVFGGSIEGVGGGC